MSVAGQVKFIFFPLLIFLAMSLTSTAALALPLVSLAWDPSPDESVTGYTVYKNVHDSSGKITSTETINVGNKNNIEVKLEYSTRYSFFVTAYEKSGVESLPSNTLEFETDPSTPTTTIRTTTTTIPNLKAVADSFVRVHGMSATNFSCAVLLANDEKGVGGKARVKSVNSSAKGFYFVTLGKTKSGEPKVIITRNPYKPGTGPKKNIIPEDSFKYTIVDATGKIKSVGTVTIQTTAPPTKQPVQQGKEQVASDHTVAKTPSSKLPNTSLPSTQAKAPVAPRLDILRKQDGRLTLNVCGLPGHRILIESTEKIGDEANWTTRNSVVISATGETNIVIAAPMKEGVAPTEFYRAVAFPPKDSKSETPQAQPPPTGGAQ